jgi:ribosome-associated translation inhibitor RaiA
MDIRVKASEYQLTREVTDHLDEKLAQIEKNAGPDSTQARIEVEIGRAAGHHKHSEYMYFAEFQLVRPGMSRLIARNNEPTINAAIDNAKDELLVQLHREKRLHSRLWRRGGAFAKRLLRLDD